MLDTSADIQKTLNATLAKFFLPPLTIAQTLEYVGDGAKKLVERALGEANAEIVPQVYADYVERFANCDNLLTKLYAGEEETLQKFSAAGIKMSIVTNKPQRATDKVFAQYLAKFGFCEVLGQTEYFPLKPNPASTLSVLERMGVDKSECVYVGDGEADVACAAAAGLRCISALWGYRKRAFLIKAGATEFARSFTELEKIVIK